MIGEDQISHAIFNAIAIKCRGLEWHAAIAGRRAPLSPGRASARSGKGRRSMTGVSILVAWCILPMIAVTPRYRSVCRSIQRERSDSGSLGRRSLRSSFLAGIPANAAEYAATGKDARATRRLAVRRDIDRYAGRFSGSAAILLPLGTKDRCALAFWPEYRPTPWNTRPRAKMPVPLEDIWIDCLAPLRRCVGRSTMTGAGVGGRILVQRCIHEPDNERSAS
jgi:hypothetical protein